MDEALLFLGLAHLQHQELMEGKKKQKEIPRDHSKKEKTKTSVSPAPSVATPCGPDPREKIQPRTLWN